MLFSSTDRTQRRVRRAVLAGAIAHNVADLTGERLVRSRPRRWSWWVGGMVVGMVAGVGALAWQGLRPASPRAEASAAGPAFSRTATPSAASAIASGGSAGSGDLAPARLSASTLRLGVRRVVVDPGHGGVDLGAAAGATLIEKDIALDLARRTRTELRRSGFEVVLTRDSDVAVALRERAAIANRAEADLFLSIHLNWLDPTVAERGIETYVLGATDDPRLEALAAAENHDSGYSFADIRNLLDGIYLDLRRDGSSRLASAIHAELLTALRADDPTLRDRGVKSAPFLVLVETGIPAVLAEVGCLSHERDAARLADPLLRDRIATALAAGVRRYARVSESVGGRS